MYMDQINAICLGNAEKSNNLQMKVNIWWVGSRSLAQVEYEGVFLNRSAW